MVAWDDLAAMVSAYERALTDSMPAWSMFAYRDTAQYQRKMRWYGSALSALPNKASVLDVGCGTGELLAWVRLPDAYCGIDVVPAFIARARQRFPQREFVVCDVLTQRPPTADIVVMLGVLGLSPCPQRLIERACALAAEATVFDYLSDDRATVRQGWLRYLKIAEVNQLLDDAGFAIRATQELGSSTTVWAHRATQAATASPDKRPIRASER